MTDIHPVPVDVIAVGAHPDDVEIGCGGTLARLVQQGYRVGIIDLTDGEPTPGSAGVEIRLEEARRAADVLGAAFRITLDLPNRRLFDTFEGRAKLATELRRWRPRLVLGLGEGTPMASPDHRQAAILTEAAVFSSRLVKWEDQFGGLAPHRVSRLLWYYLVFGGLAPAPANALVFDIGDALEKKIAAIACYESQFAHRPEMIERFRVFARQQGMAAGFAAGEALGSPTALGTSDLMGWLFPA
ncbi:MAG: PIG-L family deacetylase [Pirellulales bacterium]|nr:PIG-L family deacetylase [Pirellulales bacterium]